MFTRAETQAIVVATLGTSDDEQRIESLDGLQRERFMLHYNFPPFSVGETGRIGTGRREIGHGKLAWRAINSSLPSKDSFPYTFRIVSEITEKAKKLYEEDENYTDLDVNSQLKNLEKSIVRTDILKNKNRIDGRGLSDVRPIECEVGVLPRTHGSALFTRGETQAIVVATLGTSDDEQRIESLDAVSYTHLTLPTKRIV